MSLELSPRGAPVRTGDPVAPRVLLVVPTFGRRMPLLEATLDSLLDQAAEPADLVMVTPVDAADARALAGRSGVPVIDDPGRGLAAAVNAGFAQAGPAHRYGNWIGEDDVLLPGALAVAVARLDADPQAVVAYGDCRYLSDRGRYLYTPHAGRLAARVLAWGPDRIAQPATLLRLDAVAAVGGLDESLRHAMDLDLLLRLRRQGGFVDTGHTLAAFRWRDRAATAPQRAESAAESEQVRRRHLPRWLQPIAPLWELPVRLLDRRALARAQRAAAWERWAPAAR
jgi:GT2 family glycosyltransferase